MDLYVEFGFEMNQNSPLKSVLSSVIYFHIHFRANPDHFVPRMQREVDNGDNVHINANVDVDVPPNRGGGDNFPPDFEDGFIFDPNEKLVKQAARLAVVNANVSKNTYNPIVISLSLDRSRSLSARPQSAFRSSRALFSYISSSMHAWPNLGLKLKILNKWQPIVPLHPKKRPLYWALRVPHWQTHHRPTVEAIAAAVSVQRDHNS